MPKAKLRPNGQIKLPKQVRNSLGVITGEWLEFSIACDGVVTMRAARQRRVLGLVGLLASYGKARPASIREMNATVRKRAARLRRST